MIQIDHSLQCRDLQPALDALWEASAAKLLAIETSEEPGTPVFTVAGRYKAQGWTEWTQGFQYGSHLLQFEATGDQQFLDIGRHATRTRMASHVTHQGVHDHGFNNVSTYGNLWRLAAEGRFSAADFEKDFYELALKASGAVQAMRWSRTQDGSGFLHSFNGPHSLFCDTIRSMRSLALAHKLGHCLMSENDEPISLLGRLIQHSATTARYNVYYGKGRDRYDVRGRVAHESLFNMKDGRYRCPSTQQGYSPFSTWTRGLAWIVTGYPELLEFLHFCSDDELQEWGGRDAIRSWMLDAASASADFFIQHCPTDGVPYWDTGAPGLVHLGEYLDRPSEPENDFEPVDSSAAAIAAQGLLRLGHLLSNGTNPESGLHYWQAGLTVMKTLLQEPYLSTSAEHEGLLLHSVYHRPRDWDHRPGNSSVPRGESSQWGDYHLREAAIYLHRINSGQPGQRFFDPLDHPSPQ